MVIKIITDVCAILSLTLLFIVSRLARKIVKECEEQQGLIEALKGIINSLENDLKTEKGRVKYYLHDLEVLLKNAEENRAKIIDLENNLELVMADKENAKKKATKKKPTKKEVIPSDETNK